MSLIGNKEPAHATDVVPGPEKLDRPRVPLPSTRRMLTDEDLNTLQRSPRELVAEVDRLRLHLCVGVCMHVSVSVSVCDSLARARARSLSISVYVNMYMYIYHILYEVDRLRLQLQMAGNANGNVNGYTQLPAHGDVRARLSFSEAQVSCPHSYR